MRLRTMIVVWVALLALSASAAPVARAAEPLLQMPSFEHLQSRATDSININLGEWPLGIASWALGHDEDSQDQEVKTVLRGIKSIHVRSLAFASDHQYDAADLEPLRQQLRAPGWRSLAQVRQHGERADNVDIYLSLDHEVVNGMALIVSSPRKFVIINIVGAVNPQKLAVITSHLGLPAAPL